jgi:hypothetical protein
LGSPQRRALALFPRLSPRFVSICRLPAFCYEDDLILPRRVSSSEFLRSLSPPTAFRPELHLPGFSSLFATSRARSHDIRETSQGPASFRPRLLQPLDGLLRTLARRAYFIPLPRPGFALFRGFSPRAATLPRRKEPAPLPSLHRRSPAAFCSRRIRRAATCDASRLRGFDPRKAAFHESGYSPRPQPLPSSAFVSSRFLPLPTSAPAYRAPSAHGVGEMIVSLTSSVLPSRVWAAPSPARPVLLEFSSLLSGTPYVLSFGFPTLSFAINSRKRGSLRFLR